MSLIETAAYRLGPVILNHRSFTPIVARTVQGLTPAALHSSEVVVAKGGDSSPNPVQIWYLVDQSTSMREASGSGSKSKLALVQSRIEELTNNLATSVTHNVIPFNHDIGSLSRDLDGAAASKIIKDLHADGNTNIFKPIQKATELIKKANQENPETRHLVVLITDGEDGSNQTNEIKDACSKLTDLNAGFYTVGVGTEYNEDLLQELLEKANFGGAIHIPEQQGENPFTNILPPFVADLCSSEFFFNVVFPNSFFERAFTLTPSMREVKDSHAGNRTSMPGYQQEGLSLGLTTKPDQIDSLTLATKNQANGNLIFTEEIPIVDPDDDYSLDPQERERIKRAPWDFLAWQLALGRNAEKIEIVLEENPSMPTEFQEALEDLKQSIMDEGDEQDYRATAAAISMSVTAKKKKPNAAACNTIGPNAAGDTERAKPKQRQPEQGIRIVSSDSYQIAKEFKPGEVFKIGREASTNNIVFDDASVSRQHCQISLENGVLMIEDLGSRNGTYINDESTKITDKTEIQSGHTIRLGDNCVSFTVELI